jgi:leucyl aminopeptidase
MMFLPPAAQCPATSTKAHLSLENLERLDALLIMLPHAQAPRLLKSLPHSAPLVDRFAATEPAPGTAIAGCLHRLEGLMVVVGLLGDEPSPFQRLTLAAKMVKLAQQAAPKAIGIYAPVQGAPACEALLAALRAASEAQPTAKSGARSSWTPERIRIHDGGAADIARVDALESGAHLARWLTALPPNELNPGSYRERIARLARRHGWAMKVYSEKALARLGANAFLAVARGSATRDAAIVRLDYRPKRGVRPRRPEAPVALVGKGICFDTGGTNLKPARGMLDMHTDMAGSAVALGVLSALTLLEYPRPLTAWLALSENRIGPQSYLQQEIVRALNGVTIQVTHTDAEGRMALADTLALAARDRPAALIDFATLTGACVGALTERMSGAFTNRPALRDTIELAGHRSGERVWMFPTPSDFDEDLDSPLADIAQCLIDGKGDHIYAACFLNRFVPPSIPWLHLDLSSATRKGGLAHAPNEITGFGVRYTATLLLDDHAALVRKTGGPG